ncbi:MAG: hypothetical protein Q8O84_05325 [Nanoarchaeota archaeon]|nr:hypothetical protein [Nanoarchaeota archaeon]
MPYEIPTLIIPLVGGYFILSRSIFVSHRYENLNSQKLLFDTLIYSIPLLFGTYLVRQGIYYCSPPLFQEINLVLRKIFFPHNTVLLGTALISFFVAAFIVYPVNFILWLTKIGDYISINSIRQHGDELERFLLDASLNQKIISISLSDNKVYIGYAITVNGPQKTNYVEMLPLASGYRETENKILWITTSYESVIDAITNEDTPPLDKFKIVMNQDKIQSASFFDPQVYNKFQENMKKKQPKKNKTDAQQGL